MFTLPAREEHLAGLKILSISQLALTKSKDDQISGYKLSKFLLFYSSPMLIKKKPPHIAMIWIAVHSSVVQMSANQ